MITSRALLDLIFLGWIFWLGERVRRLEKKIK